MQSELVPIASLSLDPANVRRHPEKNIQSIIASLKRFGQQKPIVVDANGIVRAGNGTLMAAKQLGYTEIAIVRSPLKGSEATAYAIADNRTAELAEWDEGSLAEQLAALQIEDEELALATGFDEADIDALLAPDEVIEDEVPEPPEIAITKRGDVWILGLHRVMCGDSTSADDVARLMRGEKIDLCFTSPPYNSKDGGYKTDYKSKTKKFYNHQCDNRTEDEWVKFCNEVLIIIASHLSSEDSPVVWNVMYTANCRAGYGKTMFSDSHGLSVKETICWDKGAGFPTASKGILSRNWELIFVLSIGEKYTTTQTGNEPRWAKWDIARPKQQHEDHKATFPVELASKAMCDFGATEDKVYDPFLGSGSTLIAAEQLNRKCYGMEISPQYCDVIVARWEKLTGKKAQLETV